MFYDVYDALCKGIGKKPSVVAAELGINKSNVSNWKKHGYVPHGSVLQKIADYFGVTTDYLLGNKTEKAPAEAGRYLIKKEDIIFALARGRKDVITDEMFEEIQNFTDYIIQREANKKKG